MNQLKGGKQMTDTVLLEAAIKESGKKKGYLAEKCGLSYAGFRNCVTNRAEFKQSHIDILCEELNISSATRRMAIFFAKRGS